MTYVCVSPVQLPSRVWVACGQCAMCRHNRTNDFVGRCLAEQCSADETVALTLTYSGDVVGATSLYYRDVQLMLKRLRKDGFSVRYICAGEHGELKGRAHWHMVLFFRGKRPGVPFERRFSWKYWPHGFAFAQHANYDGFRYVCKYLLKEDEIRGYRKVLRLSKRPPIGAEFFQELADRMVRGGFAMHSPEYAFAHCTRRCPDGVYRARKFWLTGRSFELFAERYCASWQEAYGAPPPDSDFLWSAYYDGLVRAAVDFDERAVQRVIKPAPVSVVPYRRQVGFMLLPAPTVGVVVRYSDDSAELLIGEEDPWHVSARAGQPVSVREQLMLAGLRKTLAASVAAWLAPYGATYRPSSRRT